MKDQAIQYVAFDVHQATCEVSLRDGSGSVRLWKNGKLWDPNKLTTQARRGSGFVGPRWR